MKLLWYEIQHEKALGVLNSAEERILPLAKLLPHKSFRDMIDFIERHEKEDLDLMRNGLEEEKIEGILLEEVKVLSPIEYPNECAQVKKYVIKVKVK